MKKIQLIPRHLMILDPMVVFISVPISFFVRLGYLSTTRFYIYPLVYVTMLATMIKPIVFSMIGLYRLYWGYVAWREIVFVQYPPIYFVLGQLVAGYINSADSELGAFRNAEFDIYNI